MSSSNMSATGNAMPSCAGASRLSPISASCRRAPASATRSIWNISPRRCGPAKARTKNKTVEMAFPDTVVGTDSHTTMINGLAVLGWGVGGIEAEAAMLGQPISMLIPGDRGLQADRQAARRRHRHRSGADRHPDAAQEGRGRPASWNFTAPAWTRCRWKTAPPSPTWRRNMARPAASFRSMRRPCAISRTPRAQVAARRAGGKIRQGAGPLSHRARAPIRSSPTRCRWT